MNAADGTILQNVPTTDTEVQQGWSSLLKRAVEKNDLSTLSVQFRVSRNPELIATVAVERDECEYSNMSAQHGVPQIGARGLNRLSRRRAIEEVLFPEAKICATAQSENLTDVLGKLGEREVVEVALKHSLAVLQSEFSYLKRVARDSRQPCLLIDRHGRVHEHNIAATLFLKENGIGYSSARQLVFSSGRESAKISRMCIEHFSTGRTDTRAVIETNLMVVASQVNCGWLSEHILALLHFKKLRERVILEPQIVRSVVGLTAAQSDMVCGLLKGQSLATYAKKTGRKVCTVKWHAQKARERLNCATTSELLLLVKEMCG